MAGAFPNVAGAGNAIGAVLAMGEAAHNKGDAGPQAPAQRTFAECGRLRS
jgi:hypothetical protein